MRDYYRLEDDAGGRYWVFRLGHYDEESEDFLGYSDEPGEGKGHGFNVNYPLPLGTAWNEYRKALAEALDIIRRFSPPAIVVALGLDTFAGDPMTRFGIETGDYLEMGRDIRSLGIPVLTVLEGGYAVDAIGRNAVAFLRGVDGQ